MSRKRILQILAEIVQELGQPLSVIKCSLDMLKARNLGDLSQVQTDVVDLAGESTERMQVMIKNLLHIVGLPETMTPDAEIQAKLHQE